LNKENFENVLIIGSGSGNDTAMAITKNIKNIDAIEIDPRIIQIGKDLHPNKPYFDKRVNIINDDGRNYLNTHKDKKYDIIIFALTDSLTLASSYANTRLESYLFTMESLENAKNLLSDDGVVVFYNYYREKWLIEKMAKMLQNTTKNPVSILVNEKSNLAMMVGSKNPISLNLNIIKNKDISKYAIDKIQENEASNFARDDWPFLYLIKKSIPKNYIIISAIIIIISLSLIFLVNHKIFEKNQFSLPMFFLGLSFMLLETKNIINFQLIFGSTWIVNSAVFLAILLFALLSAIMTKYKFICGKNKLYFFMVLSLIISFLIPINKINLINSFNKYLIACFISFAPIFIANLIFSNYFKDQKNPKNAFGSNLIGAMIGGILEYLAMITGYHFLIIIIAVSYLFAFIFAIRK
jgi:predicted membrane-bound spermidine synthase